MPADIGFGCYRVSMGNAQHEQALRSALDAHITTVDTASTYTGGRSELLVGEVTAHHSCTAFITTKVGIAEANTLDQLHALELVDGALASTRSFSESLRYSLHPLFLEETLHASRQRLQRDANDCVLLHNPEMLLQPTPTTPGMASEEVYTAIGEAFAFLETERSADRIGTYGVSSNSFGSTMDTESLSVPRLLDLARQAGGSRHGFQHIQTPFNIIEHQAATTELYDGATLLEYAQEHLLRVTTNRPLNALVDNDLIRLVTYATSRTAVDAQSVEEQIHATEVVEHDLLQELIRTVGADSQQAAVLRESMRIAGSLCQSWNKFDGVVHYRTMRQTHLHPRLKALELFGVAEYIASITSVLDDLDSLYASEENASLEELRAALCKEFKLDSNTSLQHVALHAVRSTVGITTMLVGMRAPAYVADVLRIEALAPMNLERRAWQEVYTILEQLSTQ